MRALLLSLVLAAAATAQTTGNPGFNDYIINGSLSGSTSCTAVTVTTPTLLILEVSGIPGTPVDLYWSPFPCWAGSASFPTCQGTTLDLQVFPFPILLASGVTDASGFYSLNIPLPPISPPLTISTQAVLWPCGTLPLFTQAYDLTLL